MQQINKCAMIGNDFEPEQVRWKYGTLQTIQRRENWFVYVGVVKQRTTNLPSKY